MMEDVYKALSICLIRDQGPDTSRYPTAGDSVCQREPIILLSEWTCTRPKTGCHCVRPKTGSI